MITCNFSMTTLFRSDKWWSSTLSNISPATRGDAVNEGNMQVHIKRTTSGFTLLSFPCSISSTYKWNSCLNRKNHLCEQSLRGFSSLLSSYVAVSVLNVVIRFLILLCASEAYSFSKETASIFSQKNNTKLLSMIKGAIIYHLRVQLSISIFVSFTLFRRMFN